MTKIRNLLRSFRLQRTHQLSRNDSVSFEAFYNESPQQNFTETKESSLSGELINSSPDKRNKSDEYIRVSRDNVESTNCTRPSLLAILLVIILLAVFLILPLVYLLHCFGVLYIEERHNHVYPHVGVKDQVHYEPSSKVHEIFQKIASGQSKIAKTLPPPPKPDYNQCKIVEENDRFDCFPQDKVNQKSCEARGCCWIPAKTKPKNIDNPLNTPYCFYPNNYPTYNYVNVTETAYGLVAYMKRNYSSSYADDVETVKIIVKCETDSRLHIKIVDPLINRFEPPYPEVPVVDKAASNLTYQFNYDLSKPGFRVIRVADNTVLFDVSNLANFIFSNQFLQISAKLPSKYIYGIGEHRSNLLLSTDWSLFTLFNHDGIPSFNKNLYGSHPFYLLMENSTNSHGVFLLNSNAMGKVEPQHDQGDPRSVAVQYKNCFRGLRTRGHPDLPTPAITFRPIGGVLDFYIFLGPKPSDVISQYNDLIGRPYMPPYWSLGFHLCRFGYKTLNETAHVMQRNINAGIPLDTQWNDLDYMNNSNDFTYDKVSYKGLPEFLKDLHSRGMHYIPLIDAGVSASQQPGTYPPYDQGITMDIFVKNSSGQPFIGKVWNTVSTVWPDFTHPSTVDYWTMMLKSLHESIPFDGAWIDMNEPSNFLSGSFNGCPKSTLDSPPYLPRIDGGVINYKTMCMSAKHYAGLHYNVHNLYGMTEAIVTSFAMSEIRGKRPMVISRSTFPGHGHYAGHWSGDVVSDWLDMKYSIPELLSFSLFGIPMMGADICGFNGNTTEPLCNRWMQLGAFYPFSRNHNTDDGIDQDPVAMGPQVAESSRKALRVRYSLLPYLYTLFWRAHINGDTVARPLFFEFPKDVTTYNVDMQFLWGPAFMIVPVLEERDTFVNAYFPAAIWYDFYSKSVVVTKAEYKNVSAPLDTIPVFIRGGYILPQQMAMQTTTASRKNKIDLLAASDERGCAKGQIYWDDGDSLNSYDERRYTLISFKMENRALKTENVHWGSEKPPNLGSITVLGINEPVAEVFVNNSTQPFRYNTIHKYLAVDNLNVNFERPIVINWK